MSLTAPDSGAVSRSLKAHTTDSDPGFFLSTCATFIASASFLPLSLNNTLLSLHVRTRLPVCSRIKKVIISLSLNNRVLPFSLICLLVLLLIPSVCFFSPFLFPPSSLPAPHSLFYLCIASCIFCYSFSLLTAPSPPSLFPSPSCVSIFHPVSVSSFFLPPLQYDDHFIP